MLSLASLAMGAQTSLIRDGIHTVVSITKYPFLKVMNAAERAVDYAGGLVFSYNNAFEEARVVRERLANVMQHASERGELLSENQRLRRMLGFVRNEQGISLEPVAVIEAFKGHLTIDRGSVHGIVDPMCAVTDEGVVGVVTQVDPLSSNLITLHNPECKISAMIDRNRVRGIIHGSNSDLSRYCTLRYIDMKDDVRRNDLVVASPGSMFPTGFPIGRIAEIEETGSLWKLAYVEPIVDPYRLDEVFVLRQAVAPPDEMAGPLAREADGSVAPPVPDTRPLQQRYAP
jgi:rod shape-determining protein MreC